MTTTSKRPGQLHIICRAGKQGLCTRRAVRYDAILAALIERGPLMCHGRPRVGGTGPEKDAELAALRVAEEALSGEPGPKDGLHAVQREIDRIEHNRAYWDRVRHHSAEHDPFTGRTFRRQKSRGATQMTRDTEYLSRALRAAQRKPPHDARQRATLHHWMTRVFASVTLGDGALIFRWRYGGESVIRFAAAGYGFRNEKDLAKKSVGVLDRDKASTSPRVPHPG